MSAAFAGRLRLPGLINYTPLHVTILHPSEVRHIWDKYSCPEKCASSGGIWTRDHSILKPCLSTRPPFLLKLWLNTAEVRHSSWITADHHVGLHFTLVGQKNATLVTKKLAKERNELSNFNKSDQSYTVVKQPDVSRMIEKLSFLTKKTHFASLRDPLLALKQPVIQSLRRS